MVRQLRVMAILLGLAGNVPAQDVLHVKIGLSSPLTGPQASAGKDNQGGVLLAIEKLNAQGMVINGRRARFELVSEDDQGDPRAGVNVAQKLVDQGMSAIIGPYNSGVTIPASRIYNDAGITSMTVASNLKITEQGYQHLYRVGPSDKQLGGKMALYAARELKMKTVSVIDDRTAYGQGLAREFTRVAQANGLQVISHDYTNDKATDFTAILTAIKSKQPQAIFIGGYASQGGPLRRQMRQLGMQQALLGGDGICSPEMGRLSGEAIGENVYCIQGGAMLSKLEHGKTFTRQYQQRFQRPPEVYAVNFYDGMMLVAHAMQQAGSIDPAVYGPVLAKIRYQGVAGIYEFDAQHDMKDSPVTVFHFHEGLPRALTSY